jgi:uncharacterized protein (DUF1697 family)
MNWYVALIRGINVGGKHTLPMKELTQVLTSIGCHNVKTYIQSGNVVFQSGSSAAQLGEAIADEIVRCRSFKPHVLVLQKSEFKRAVENNPFPEGESDPKALHFGFLDSVPSSPDLHTLEALRAPSERIKLIGRVFYLFAPDGVGRSKLAANSEKALGVPMTDRNCRTVGKIMSMLQEQDE